MTINYTYPIREHSHSCYNGERLHVIIHVYCVTTNHDFRKFNFPLLCRHPSSRLFGIMSVNESRISFCEGMAALCLREAKRWESIELMLSDLEVRRASCMTRGSKEPEPIPEVDETVASDDTDSQPGVPALPQGPLTHEPVGPAGVPPEAQQPVVAPPAPQVNPIIWARIGHLLRWSVLLIALSLPRFFYYLFSGYALLVVTGLLDALKSIQLRHYMSGSRPSLNIQLVRLRERSEALKRLLELREEHRELNEEEEREVRKHEDFLATFVDPQVHYLVRFVYQLVFMFVYSAFPDCYPHSQYLA